MKHIFLGTLTVGWFAAVPSVVGVIETAQAQETDREALCRALSDEFVQRPVPPEIQKDYRQYAVSAFYSEALNACIHTERWLFGPDVEVRDLTGSVVKPAQSGAAGLLLSCDSHGVNEVDVEVARAHHGRVWGVPYEDYLTDGRGGPPATLQGPAEPYTSEDCQEALDRWFGAWR